MFICICIQDIIHVVWIFDFRMLSVYGHGAWTDDCTCTLWFPIGWLDNVKYLTEKSSTNMGSSIDAFEWFQNLNL